MVYAGILTTRHGSFGRFHDVEVSAIDDIARRHRANSACLILHLSQAQVLFCNLHTAYLLLHRRFAAIAAAKSPPDALPNANGKLLGPNTATGPMAPKHERMFVAESMIGIRHVSSRAACAACRS